MLKQLKIPVGVSDFRKIRENGYYYMDKSGLIEELLKTDATEVTLITRPRRFGKNFGNEYAGQFFGYTKRQQIFIFWPEDFSESGTMPEMDESVAYFVSLF